MNESLKDKVCIITGATSGIGRTAALKFAQKGSKVILACRNSRVARLVQEEIAGKTGNQNIDHFPVDMSLQKSIKKFSDQFNAKYDSLDILIHNAARMDFGSDQYIFSEDNLELTFAANTFGPFLLSNLMMDKLQNSNNGRIINIGSAGIYWFHNPNRSIPFDSLHKDDNHKMKFNAYKAYGDSKMASALLTLKMAQAFSSSKVTVQYLILPDVKKSKEFIQSLPFPMKIIAKLINPFSLKIEQAAQLYLYLALNNNKSGVFINSKNKEIQAPKYAYNEENQKRMWELCEKFTGVDFNIFTH